MRVQVEVCVTSVEEARIAAAAGVDSIEVCSWLGSGGITPSSGLVDAIRSAVDIHTRILIRPNPGTFVYGMDDMAVLLTDVEVFGGGALSLVTGALDDTGLVHEALMEGVKRAAPESSITFHRAIDHSSDPSRVLEQCVAIGVGRILTSGRAKNAIEGVEVMKQLVERASDRITIAAAAGIDASNVVELVERTGVKEVHFSAQRPRPAPSERGVFPRVEVLPEGDRQKVEGVLEALDKAGLR